MENLSRDVQSSSDTSPPIVTAAVSTHHTAGSQATVSAFDRAMMQRCLELARRALGQTAPNPLVGAVVVREGQIVGEGFHPGAGQPHAEVFALQAAGERSRGATVYVNLEPCNHYGRTPPCSEALVAAEVARVVVGMVDPNPKVGGGVLHVCVRRDLKWWWVWKKRRVGS